MRAAGPGSKACGGVHHTQHQLPAWRRSLRQQQLLRRRTLRAPVVRADQEALLLSQEAHDEPAIEAFGFRPGFDWEFDRGPMIGSGSFGVVHVARHIKTGQTYAVKSIPKVHGGEGYCLEPGFVRRVFHEVDIARLMGQSLNVIHLVEAYEDDVNVELVMELASGGSLWGRMKQGPLSDEAEAARIIADVLRAVAQCHAKGVAIRDVKPDNFLFTSRRPHSPLKMVDFGLADRPPPGGAFTERVGTPFYIAPDVLQEAYSFPADVWSAGVTAYQLLSGRLPWANDAQWVAQVGSASSSANGYGLSTAAQLGSPGGSNVTSSALWGAILGAELDFTWPPWGCISGGARDLVQAMLTRDPQQRPTAAELLQHPWLVSATACRSCWSTSSASASDCRTCAGEAMASSSSSNGSERQRQQQQQQPASGVSGGGAPLPLYLRPIEDSLVQRLQRYGTFTRLKQVALRRIVAAMTPAVRPSCVAVYVEAFNSLDEGGTGRLPASRLAALLSSELWDLSEVEVTMLVGQFDLDRNGSVDAAEWISALIDWPLAQQHPSWPTWVQQVFDEFDADGDGLIAQDELLAQLGLDGGGDSALGSWSDLGLGRGLEQPPQHSASAHEALRSLLRAADTNGDGVLDFGEFRALVETHADDTLALFASRRTDLVGVRLQSVAASVRA